jgi:hypothetical protein
MLTKTIVLIVCFCHSLFNVKSFSRPSFFLFNMKAQSSTAQTTNSVASDSWTSIATLLREREQESELLKLKAIASGYGPSSQIANIRLFGQPKDFKPEIIFYRDRAGWCPYCEKVRLCPYRTSILNILISTGLVVSRGKRCSLYRREGANALLW